MKRSLNRVLLAGVSASALLVYGSVVHAADVATVSVNGTTYSNSGQSVSGATSANGAAGSTADVGAAIMATGSNSTINITGGTITGGQGGTGGDANVGANNGGDGGDASAIYVPLTKTGVSISISQGATVTGGTGGNGGAAGGAGGTAGQNGTAYGVDIRAANATLTNSGTIQSGTSGTTGGANGGTAGTYNLSGAVGISGEGAATGASITNSSTGQIIGVAGIGIAAAANNATIVNRGTITTSGDASGAIDVFSGYANTSITNYGTISAATTHNDTPTIANSGTGTSITNYGTISKSTNGTNDTAVSNNSATGAATLTNYGTITGRIKASDFGDTFTFDGSQGGATLTGNITGYGANTGAGHESTVIFQSGTTTFTGNITESNTVSISSGGILVLGQTTSIVTTSGLTNNGTFNLGTYATTVTGGAITGSGTIKTSIGSGSHGYIINDGNTSTNLSSMTITPVVSGSVANGTKYLLVKNYNGSAGAPTVSNAGGYKWTASIVAASSQTDADNYSYGSTNNALILTASGSTTAATTTVANSKGLTTLATYSGSNTAMTSLSNAVNNLTATADIEKAAAQLRPSTNGSTTQAALGAVGQAINTISIRTDSVRAASADTNGGTGVSSGESLRGLGVWTQGFGSSATQDKRLGVDGYSADTYGLAFGADVKVMEPVRVGVSFAYARTNVADSGSRDGSGQNINSYIGSLYGTYTANRWYVDGAVTYGKHDYSGTRVIAITGAATQTAKSSYSGEQYGAKAELGVPFPVGPATVTPLLSLAYNHLNQDAYTETNAAAALSVGSSSTDSIKSGLGAKVSATVAQWGDWNVKPNARAIWNHEFNSSSHNQTSAYVDGGSSFTNASSEIASESFNLGIGLDLASVRNTTLSAKYDAGLSDRYVSHTGSLQARMEF